MKRCFITFSGVFLVTKPTKSNWKSSNSVADRINSGGYDLPGQRTSHVHLGVNSINDGSPTILVHTALVIADCRPTVSVYYVLPTYFNCCLLPYYADC